MLQVLDQHTVWLQTGQVGYVFLTYWTQSWGASSGQVEEDLEVIMMLGGKG